MWLPGTYHNGFAPRDGVPRYPHLWRGCVGAWCPALGPSGLTLRDWGPRRLDMTLTSMDAATDWTVDKYYGIDFQGSSGDQERAEITGVPATAQFTAYAFCKALATGIMNPIGKTNASFSRSAFYLRSAANSGFTDDAGSYYEVASPTLTVGSLQMIALTYDGATLSTWLNGKVHSAASHSATPATTALTMAIGRSGGFNGQYFHGVIFTAGLFARALSATEMQMLSQRPGVAYELAPRRRAGETSAAAFQSSWAYRSNLLLSSGGQW